MQNILVEAAKGYSRKKYLGGEDGRQYIFLWVVGAESLPPQVFFSGIALKQIQSVENMVAKVFRAGFPYILVKSSTGHMCFFRFSEKL